MMTLTTTHLTDAETKQWMRVLNRVLTPTRVHRILSHANGGLMLVAELEQGRKLHLGLDPQGINLCGVWSGEECVVWDRDAGFHATSGLVPPPANVGPSPFEKEMRPYIEKICRVLEFHFHLGLTTPLSTPRSELAFLQ